MFGEKKYLFPFLYEEDDGGGDGGGSEASVSDDIEVMAGEREGDEFSTSDVDDTPSESESTPPSTSSDELFPESGVAAEEEGEEEEGTEEDSVTPSAIPEAQVFSEMDALRQSNSLMQAQINQFNAQAAAAPAAQKAPTERPQNAEFVTAAVFNEIINAEDPERGRQVLNAVLNGALNYNNRLQREETQNIVSEQQAQQTRLSNLESTFFAQNPDLTDAGELLGTLGNNILANNQALFSDPNAFSQELERHARHLLHRPRPQDLPKKTGTRRGSRRGRRKGAGAGGANNHVQNAPALAGGTTSRRGGAQKAQDDPSSFENQMGDMIAATNRGFTGKD